jgi:integrase
MARCIDLLAGTRDGPTAIDGFHPGRGTALNPNNVLNRVLHPACKRAGIPIVSWHNFRYTFSTWANPTGESIKALQSQLGHTDARLTLDVYTQPMPEAQKLLAGKVARVLLPVAPKSHAADQNVNGLIN